MQSMQKKHPLQGKRAICLLFLFGLGICLGVGLMPAWGQTQEEDIQEKILDVFFPYRQGVPQVEGITPGMKINKDNFQVAEKVLPPEILQVVQAGDLEISIQETTDFPLRAEYVSATIEHFGQAQIGENGQFKNYTKGLPFPLLDPADPQAGLKTAWNFRYRDVGDSLQTQGILNSVNNSGGVERSVEIRYHRLYGMHRLSPDRNVPVWEKEGTWSKEHILTLRPSDLEGSQLLTVHPDADTSAQEKWAYDPQTRRTRKIVYNPYETTFGLNFLVEDYYGFAGYLHAHTWRYQGEQVMLVPGFLRGGRPTPGGKNNWYPMIPWELRKVVIVEATPKDSDHPYGKRRFYIDRQTFYILYVFIYDDDGNHWRTLFHSLGNPKFDPENTSVGVPLHVGTTWIDYKTNHASVWIEKKVLYNRPLSPEIFTVKEMMRKGK